MLKMKPSQTADLSLPQSIKMIPTAHNKSSNLTGTCNAVEIISFVS